MKKPLRSIVDYLSLTFIVSIAILMTLVFNGNRGYQQMVIIGLSILYIIWGVFHHHREKTLYIKV